MSEIVYGREPGLSIADYVSVVGETSLGPSRPLGDHARVAEMLANANIIITAREHGRCVGLARGLTDFAWVCFLGDLAVRESMQGRGIGTALMRKLRDELGERVSVSLNAAHEAVSFYDQAGPDSDLGAIRTPTTGRGRSG